jgi:hypothetical protein
MAEQRTRKPSQRWLERLADQRAPSRQLRTEEDNVKSAERTAKRGAAAFQPFEIAEELVAGGLHGFVRVWPAMAERLLRGAHTEPLIAPLGPSWPLLAPLASTRKTAQLTTCSMMILDTWLTIRIAVRGCCNR